MDRKARLAALKQEALKSGLTQKDFEEQQFEVEDISALWYQRCDRAYFYVSWKGYDKSQDSWEPLKSVQYATHVLEALKARIPPMPVAPPEIASEEVRKNPPTLNKASLALALEKGMTLAEYKRQKLFKVNLVRGIRFVDEKGEDKTELQINWKNRSGETWEPVEGIVYEPDAYNRFLNQFPRIPEPLPLNEVHQPPAEDEEDENVDMANAPVAYRRSRSVPEDQNADGQQNTTGNGGQRTEGFPERKVDKMGHKCAVCGIKTATIRALPTDRTWRLLFLISMDKQVDRSTLMNFVVHKVACKSHFQQSYDWWTQRRCEPEAISLPLESGATIHVNTPVQEECNRYGVRWNAEILKRIFQKEEDKYAQQQENRPEPQNHGQPEEQRPTQAVTATPIRRRNVPEWNEESLQSVPSKVKGKQGKKVLPRRRCIICDASISEFRTHQQPKETMILFMLAHFGHESNFYLNNDTSMPSCRIHTKQSFQWWKQQPNEINAISIRLLGGSTVHLNTAVLQELERHGISLDKHNLIKLFQRELRLVHQYGYLEALNNESADEGQPTLAKPLKHERNKLDALEPEQNEPERMEPASPERMTKYDFSMMDYENVHDMEPASPERTNEDIFPIMDDDNAHPRQSPVNNAGEYGDPTLKLCVGQQFAVDLPAGPVKLQLVLDSENRLMLQHIGADGAVTHEHNIDSNISGHGEFRMVRITGEHPKSQYIGPAAADEGPSGPQAILKDDARKHDTPPEHKRLRIRMSYESDEHDSNQVAINDLIREDVEASDRSEAKNRLMRYNPGRELTDLNPYDWEAEENHSQCHQNKHHFSDPGCEADTDDIDDDDDDDYYYDHDEEEDFPAVPGNEPTLPESSRTLNISPNTITQRTTLDPGDQLDSSTADFGSIPGDDLANNKQTLVQMKDPHNTDKDRANGIQGSDSNAPEQRPYEEANDEGNHGADQQAALVSGGPHITNPPITGFVLNEVLEDDGDDYVQYVGRMTDEIRIQRIERGEKVDDMRAHPNPYWTGKLKIWYPSMRIKKEEPDHPHEVRLQQPKAKQMKMTKKTKKDSNGEFPGYRENDGPETSDEEIRTTINLWKTTETCLENILDSIAKDPKRVGVCVFCERHYASVLCQKYPKHNDRLGVTKRNGGCLACGGQDHKRNEQPTCNETELCIGCGKTGHYLEMCSVFKNEAIVNKYTLLRCSNLPLEGPNRKRRGRGRGGRRGGR